MTTPFPFASGAVLQAQQLNDITNLPINNQTASYTLLVGDAGKRVIMNVGSANTVTVNDNVFTTGDTIFIANIGTATTTLTEGSGVDIETSGSLQLAQYGGGTLVALSASTFTFFPAGVKNTLSVEFLLVGGGAGGAVDIQGGGGGAGGMITGTGIIAKGTTTVVVGAGGAGGVGRAYAANGTGSGFVSFVNGGGGGGPRRSGGASGGSGGGGGASENDSEGIGGVGVSGQGNNGSNGGAGASTDAGGGGGKGGAGTVSNGGAAATNDFTGNSISYAGGGGGLPSGTGGTGAGNAGVTGGSGTANRGGGGGAGSTTAGNGGSGQVVVRYLTADASGLTITTTGTVTTGTDGTRTFHRFDSTGTLVVA